MMQKIGQRIHVFSIRCWMFDVRRFVHQERNRPAGRLRAGRFELIKQNEPTWLLDEHVFEIVS
jgi:hypothetical protein